jgi:hypothetical protein
MELKGFGWGGIVVANDRGRFLAFMKAVLNIQVS